VRRVGRTARAGRSGWSLSLVTQYDVQLVHAIEELVGHSLEAHSLDEAEVLKGITKVGRCAFDVMRCAVIRKSVSRGLQMGG
jgi:superfamily II DNA/RNA helicase